VEVITMRTSLAVLSLAVGVLVGYSFRTVPVNAQQAASDWLHGETVRLSVELPGGTLACKVTQVHNGFIGCAGDHERRRGDQWVNLRFVKFISPLKQ
jgi:hypothetical protein